MSTNTSKELPIKELDDGLIMRHARREDAQALAEFNGLIHKDEDEERSDFVYNWTIDLATKEHPTFDVSDFIIIEDTKTGQIASSMNLINQIWSYGGIPFPAGRPEIVGTHKDYRRRGLVREMFDVAHRISEERGHLLQGITGIPWYYRMFGYDMALNLGGGKVLHKVDVPKLKKDQEEAFRIRPAATPDIPFITKLHNKGCERSLVSCVWDEAQWNYDLNIAMPFGKTLILEDLDGNPVGFFRHNLEFFGNRMPLVIFEILDSVCWIDAGLCVMRYLNQAGEEIAAKDKKKNYEYINFNLGMEHPVFDALVKLFPDLRKPYAWYIRVPDLSRFLNHIKPVLQQRLDSSAARNWNGNLKISMYRSGIEFEIDQGKIMEIKDWKPEDIESGDFIFPDLSFYQALMGYRSLEELDANFADCYSLKREKWAVVQALFPKENSNVFAVM